MACNKTSVVVKASFAIRDMFCIIFTIFSLPIFLVEAEIQKQPHIIFVVADDLGWNDVSWHNPKIFTPNLETLAREGVILNQSYVQAVCTPSRVSFMTGYYPYHVGRQNHVLHPLVPSGVPLRFKFLPEKLREIGYSTHMIGKWHLGYCNFSYTPTQRGFDTFFGFYNGALDYYSHTRSAKRRGPHAKWNEPDLDVGFDLRNNSRASRKYNGVYSTTLIADAAKDLICSHDPEVPLYLYLSFQSVHGPLQVPKNYEDMYSHIPDVNRKKFSGMVSAMDDAIGNVVRALKDHGFWENSLFVFTTDNGGQTVAGGNNWPLRGNKGTQWEGATRAVTFIHKSSMKKNGYVNNKLFHAVDWFPTLIGIAGGKPVPGIDGVDQWRVLSEDADAVRTEFVYNIYDVHPRKGAIRVGDYKLIMGLPGNPSGWIAPKDGSRTEDVQCRIKLHSDDGNGVDVRLYHLKEDPLELHDLAGHLPTLVKTLKEHLENLASTMVPADDPSPDKKGDPRKWGGNFSSGWCIAQ